MNLMSENYVEPGQAPQAAFVVAVEIGSGVGSLKASKTCAVFPDTS